MIKIANRTREIRPSGMKRGACGNVMHGLTSLCHEAGNGGNNGRRCPKHARTVFLPDLDLCQAKLGESNWLRSQPDKVNRPSEPSFSFMRVTVWGEA